MPKYKVNINRIISQDDVKEMISRAKDDRDKFIVSLLYLTGARPQELCFDEKTHRGLIKKDIKIQDDSVIIIIRTLKLGKTTKFRPDERKLEFRKDAPFMKHVLKYWKKHKNDDFLLPFTTTRLRQTVYRLGLKRFCVYNFRHSRLTKLIDEGATSYELMRWKGSSDIRSIEPYLRGKKIGRRLKIE